MFRILVKLQVL